VILLIELLLVAGVSAVAVNWWVAWQRQQRQESGALPPPPPEGAPRRLRWLLKEGRLGEAAKEASQRLMFSAPPPPGEDAPKAEDELSRELERALSEMRAQRDAVPEVSSLPPLTREERQLIADGDRLAAVRGYVQRTGASLDEAMSVVSRTAATALDAPEYSLTPTEQRMLIDGNIITVIKLVRERTGLSLLRAKELVERKLRELE